MRLKKALGRILTTACMSALLFSTPVSAEVGGNDASYTYTVTLYAVNQGSFTGTDGVSVSGSGQITYADQEQIQITGLKYGDRISVTPQAGMTALQEDSKYYIQGIRESGRDNNTVGNSSFAVDSDREYVVAYGIRGNMVTYQVNYQDAQGNTLAPSQNFYGVVGDRPVVAFQYIEGYQPQAYNLTGTLGSNEADNVFTFVYRPVQSQQTGENGGQDAGTQGTSSGGTQSGAGGSTNGAETGGAAASQGTTGGTAAGNAATGTGTAGTAGGTGTTTGTGTGTDTGAAAGTGTNTGTAAGTGAAGDNTLEGEAADGTADTQTDEEAQADGAEEAEEGDAPEELESIDDEDTPLGNVDLDEESNARPVGDMPVFIGIAAVAAVGIGVVTFLLLKNRKRH